MATAMKTLGKPRAAADILDWCAGRTGAVE
jgi:hypothetical protein